MFVAVLERQLSRRIRHSIAVANSKPEVSSTDIKLVNKERDAYTRLVHL